MVRGTNGHEKILERFFHEDAPTLINTVLLGNRFIFVVLGKGSLLLHQLHIRYSRVQGIMD